MHGHRGQGILPYEAESSVDHALSLLGSEWVAVIKAFLDESRHHAGSKVVAIAGYMIHSRYWPRFEREWKNVLFNFTPRLREPFHMNEYTQPRIAGHQFSGWEKPKLDELMGKLLGVIHKRPFHLFGFGCAVYVDEFERLPAVARNRYHDDPWFLAFETSIGFAAKYLDDRGDVPQLEKIGLTFDRKDGFVGKATELYNNLMEGGWSHSHRLADPLAFGTKEKFAALQAADLIAYEVGTDLERKITGTIDGIRPYKMRYPLEQITTVGPCMVLSYDAEAFRKNLKYLTGDYSLEQQGSPPKLQQSV